MNVMRARILIVDDDPSSVFLLGQILSEMGDIFFSTSGEGSLKQVLEKKPDIVLLDAEMPGLSGFDVCAAIKKNEKTGDIPVIFVTASTDIHSETRALDMGAVDFITKPFNPPIVRARIAAHLAQSQRNRARQSRLMNIYRALSVTNEAIIHSNSDFALFPLVCRIAVECGGMLLAWVGIPDETGRFVPVASAGMAKEYINDVTVMSTTAFPEGRGHGGSAFRNKKPSIARDIDSDETTRPWRDTNRKYGIKSLAAFPIMRRRKSYALFTVYSDQADAFDEEIVRLLEEMTGNISFALDNFDREVKREKAESALRESETRFRHLADAMPQLVWTTDPGGRVDYYNQRRQEYFGFSCQEAGAFDWIPMLHPGDVEATMRAWRNAVETGDLYQIEHRMLRADGIYRWHISRGILAHNEHGEAVKWFCTSTDIHELKQAQEALQRSEERLRLAQDATRIGTFEWNIKTNESVWSPGLESLYGLRPGEFGRTYEAWRSLIHKEDLIEFERNIQESLNSGVFEAEWRTARSEGQMRWVSARAQVFRDESGQPERMVGINMDVTEKKKSDELIWTYANFDALTGLPNRRLFRDRLKHEIQNSRRARLTMALMFLDLDGFKDVNDTLGHDMGDVLLREAAKRLQRCVRESDTVARLGGDEFTVILPEIHDPSSIDRVAENILKALSEPIMLGNDIAYVSASIGITLYPDDATDIEDLLKNADQAMYAAKQRGKNQYQYFTASMQAEAIARMRLINDLRGALENSQFEIVYQPIVDLSTGLTRKAEALIRWQHPTKGLVKPIDFISAAEDTGMMTSFGNWIFHEAAKQVASWREKYHPEFQISINISPVQFRNEGIDSSIWFEQLRNLGLPGHGIVIEITEGLLLDASSNVTDQLLMLRDAGIEVALDDFGTGYSSLSYLKKFDIDYIKIDQSFVRNLSVGSDDMALCEAIIVMAHKLDLKVIAEGIETDRQRHLLTASGCDFGQGFYFSRPVSASEMGESLESSHLSRSGTETA